MVKRYHIEGDIMLTLKKNEKQSINNVTIAKKEDVLKAVMKSNKKHTKMMQMLAR